MMESITERQFRTWWAYHLFVEPLESDRMDRRFGLLVCAIEAMLFGDDAGLQPGNFDLSYREQAADAGTATEATDWRLMKSKMDLACQQFAASQSAEE